MSKRSNALGAVSVFIVLCASGAAAQNAVEANGPLTLSVNPSSPISEQGDSGADTTVDSGARSIRAEDPNADQKALPQNERRSLGLPGSAPTPLQAEATAPVADQGLMSQLDPRSNDVTKVIGALAIVVGLILLLKVFLRKSGGFLASGGRPSGVIEILAKYPVGRGQSVVLIKVARRVLLVHQTTSSMTPLSELTEPDEVAGLLTRLEAGSTERDADRFRRTLTQFMAEHESAPEKSARTRRAGLPAAETEIVDLTRSRRGLASMLVRRSAG